MEMVHGQSKFKTLSVCSHSTKTDKRVQITPLKWATQSNFPISKPIYLHHKNNNKIPCKIDPGEYGNLLSILVVIIVITS